MVLGAALSSQSFGGDLLGRLLGGKGCGAASSCCDTSVCDPSCGAEIASCDPSCGAELASCGKGCGLLGKGLLGPSCGCEVADPCAAPTCGAEIADPCGCGPSCGVEASCCTPRRTPILDAIRKDLAWRKAMLRGMLASKNSCCDTSCDPCGPTCGAEIAACGPSCGAEIAACDPCAAPSCDSGCGKRCGGGLLGKIFAKKICCDSGCPTACDAIPADSSCSSCGSAPAAAPAPAPAAAPAAPAPVVDPHAYLNTKRHVIQASSTRIR